MALGGLKDEALEVLDDVDGAAAKLKNQQLAQAARELRQRISSQQT